MYQRLFLTIGLCFISFNAAWAQEGAETLSPAELALQQQQLEVEAMRFQAYCERIILDGNEPVRSQFIDSLSGQTCSEVAQTILAGEAN